MIISAHLVRVRRRTWKTQYARREYTARLELLLSVTTTPLRGVAGGRGRLVSSVRTGGDERAGERGGRIENPQQRGAATRSR
jgi:hypothetical protein